MKKINEITRRIIDTGLPIKEVTLEVDYKTLDEVSYEAKNNITPILYMNTRYFESERNAKLCIKVQDIIISFKLKEERKERIDFKH